MAFLKEVLRPRKSKPKKPPPKTNAQKLREYKERIKADPVLYAAWKEKKGEENKKRRENLTDAKRQHEREISRLRMAKHRSRQKAQSSSERQQKKKDDKRPSKHKQTNKQHMTRVQTQKAIEKRQANRLRQQKRRATMSSQKKRRENEKRRYRYHLKKEHLAPTPKPKAKIRLDSLLKGVHNAIKNSRNKLSLFKMNFLRKFLARQKPAADNSRIIDSFYKRPARNNFAVEQFLEKHSINFPGLRGSTTQKKVLTRTMIDRMQEFKETYPNLKMSLTTFKRRRPRHIVLSSSRKFLQCLCEKCENIMLLVEGINPFMQQVNVRGNDSDSETVSTRRKINEKIRSAEDLIQRTLCFNSTRECWDRLFEMWHCTIDVSY